MRYFIYIFFFSFHLIAQEINYTHETSNLLEIKIEFIGEFWDEINNYNNLNEISFDTDKLDLENIYYDNSSTSNHIPSIDSIESSISNYFHSQINVIEHINNLFYFNWIEINTIEDYRFASNY